MENDPAILALLEAFAADVEEGAQLMDLAEDDMGLEEMPGIGAADEDDDDDDPPTQADPELQGQPAAQRGVRRPREEPPEGAAPVDEDAYWNDNDGEGDANVIHRRHLRAGMALVDEDDDGEGLAGRFDDDDDDDDVDEDERASEGMILPKVDPSVSWNLYMLEFWRVLSRMGTETTALIGRIVRDGQPLSVEDRHRISVWIKYWTGYMIEFHYHGVGRIIR
jgi:hypothetical protein